MRERLRIAAPIALVGAVLTYVCLRYLTDPAQLTLRLTILLTLLAAVVVVPDYIQRRRRKR